ncbi:CPBP family intramembrane glutamic endopeptidase [Aestuariimicrobium ganziense]|uniref:CPBP family intramembrane glutamic endopeptidase n=1 Tax=Aestuariimicrobium ganziense TaxID=2773677 RepID=UPI002E2C7785|nr:CPBP family intramembrane glutamic endopeptidase [Aestuariimicrobium ganziense]
MSSTPPPGGLVVLEKLPPPSGVGYTQVLRSTDGRGVVRGGFGVALALAGYAIFAPLIAQLVLGLGWLLRGRPDSFSSYFRTAMAYELPDGLVASHLGLASLIGLSMLLVRWWHRRGVRWLVSVQPGMRWRYLLGCLLIAAVGLNVVLWLGQLGTPWVLDVDTRPWLWLLVIILFAPLQAAGEEFFFRGYLMQALGALVTNRWFGVVLSALVFALFHGVQNTWLFIDRLAFGLLAGALVLITGGLEAAIAAHVANNLFAFGYAVFFGGVAATKSLREIGPVDAAVDIAGFLVVGLGAWWLARRMRVATTTP